MKSIRFMLALFAVIASARAADITLIDGRTFTDAKVASQTPTHVTLRHAGGFQQVSKKLLPADLAAQYPLDEAAAEESKKRDAEFREARAKAMKENEAARLEKVAAQRVVAAAQEEQEAQAIADSALDAALGEKVVSAKFNVYRINKSTPVGLPGVHVFFCTPEQWAAYQETRRGLFEDEYKKQCNLIHAQGYDRDGYSAAHDVEWLRFRRWLRGTYAATPEHFASTKTAAKGTFVIPVSQRPFVMFARSERTESEGWDRYVWIANSSSFEPGVQEMFYPGSAVREEPWAKLARRSTLTTNVDGD